MEVEELVQRERCEFSPTQLASWPLQVGSSQEIGGGEHCPRSVFWKADVRRQERIAGDEDDVISQKRKRARQ